MQTDRQGPGLRGRTALVTAASQGIGKAIALELRRRGAHVIVASKDPGRLLLAEQELLRLEGDARVSSRVMDLLDEGAVRTGIEAVLAQQGQIDILVTNSGGLGHRPVMDATNEDWERALTNKFRSLLWLVSGVVPAMRRAGSGVILNVGSIYSKEPKNGYALTNSVRLMATGFLKALSDDLAPHGIRVNQMLCGFVETDRLRSHFEDVARLRGVEYAEAVRSTLADVPMGRFAQPVEIARVAAFLVSDDASYMTGQGVVIDGGMIRTAL